MSTSQRPAPDRQTAAAAARAAEAARYAAVDALAPAEDQARWAAIESARGAGQPFSLTAWEASITAADRARWAAADAAAGRTPTTTRGPSTMTDFARFSPQRTPAEQAAWDADFARGVAMERARITAIFALPEAEGRFAQAKALALCEDEVSPALAATLLASSPLLPKAGGQGSALDMSFAGKAEGFAAGQEIGRRFSSAGGDAARSAGGAGGAPQGAPAQASDDPFEAGAAIGRRCRSAN